MQKKHLLTAWSALCKVINIYFICTVMLFLKHSPSDSINFSVGYNACTALTFKKSPGLIVVSWVYPFLLL